MTAESVGRKVLGPIVAEFCLRLWSFASLLDRREDAAFLFCARGGLRMQFAYDRFLSASGLEPPAHAAPLMVSRVVAMRPALMRTVEGDLDTLEPAAATTLSREFPSASLLEVSLAMSGVAPLGPTAAWDRPHTSDEFAALLHHPDGAPVVEALRQQSTLFVRHLHEALDGRSLAVLVDTGLYGTTCRLLTEALPDIDVSSLLIALSYPPGPFTRPSKTFGLTVEAEGYSPLVPRTSLFRYWHFVEWLFEPDLPSVRTFHDENGLVRSNLEAAGWQERVPPRPGTAFAGVIDYLDALHPGPAEQILRDAPRAWTELRRSLVWPRPEQAEALSVGQRSHDFGRDENWSARQWRGPVASLRGSTMWREGEIARSGTRLRAPLLAAIEGAYAVRHVRRAALRRRSRGD